jgi:hypothetical protein
LDECRERFQLYKPILPILLSIDPDLCSQSSLQAMSDTVRNNPSYGLAHLAVELDYKNVITSTLLSQDP